MTELIVSTEWLYSRLGQEGIVILDVTWYADKDAQQQYNESHIPGARFFNFMRDAKPTKLFPRNIPEMSDFEAQLREVGVNQDSHIVVYDTSTNAAGYYVGARAAWMCRFYGCEKVSVLDGGFPKWIADGYKTTNDVPTVTPGNYTATTVTKMRTQIEAMLANLNEPRFQVLDSRIVEQYKNGHLPNAIHISLWTELLDKDQKQLKTVDELKQVFSSNGVDLNKPIVTYCNTGMSACSLFLAADMCGAKDLSMYHGSITEWKAVSPENVIAE